VPDQAAFDQGVQAIINGGHRDVGHASLGPQEDLFHRGVVALFQQHIEHMLALRREPKAARGQPLVQMRVQGMLVSRTHKDNQILIEGPDVSIFGIILNIIKSGDFAKP